MSDTGRFGFPLAARPDGVLQSIGAVEFRELRARVQGDVRRLFDAANEILRHALGQTVGADQHVHAPTGPGEKDRSLARGITAADDRDLFGRTQRSLQVSGSIVDATTKKK